MIKKGTEYLVTYEAENNGKIVKGFLTFKVAKKQNLEELINWVIDYLKKKNSLTEVIITGLCKF